MGGRLRYEAQGRRNNYLCFTHELPSTTPMFVRIPELPPLSRVSHGWAWHCYHSVGLMMSISELSMSFEAVEHVLL